MRLLTVVLVSFLLGGCATRPPTSPLPPGAINPFDAYAFRTLRTIEETLADARPLIKTFPQFKVEYDKAVDAYNAAAIIYKTYHTAAAAGLAVDQPTVAARISEVLAAAGVLLAKLKPTARALIWRPPCWVEVTV